MTCGIYLLGFNDTEKVYVGKSIHIEKRYLEHCNELKRGLHTDKMNTAFISYGMPSLEILEVCTKDKLKELEEYHIKLWDAVSNGFNYLYNSNGGSCSGEDHHMSTHSNNEIINLLIYIVSNPTDTLISISKQLNISYSIVKRVSNGLGHTWLQDTCPNEYAKLLALKGTRNNKGENQGASKFTNDQIYSAFKLLLEDITTSNKSIAEKCGISETCVKGICSGTRYTWLKEQFPIEWEVIQSKLAEKRAYSRSAKARGIEYPPIISPLDNSIHYIDNVNKFAKANGLDTGSLNKLLNRKSNSVKGWKLYQEEKMLP